MGKTDNPMKRYQEHLNGLGSAWTRKYRPIGLEKIIEKANAFDEDRYVKEYMNKFGIDKVRGGAYVMEELPEFQEEALKSELWGATDKCTTCGRKGHWAKDCNATKDITGAELYEGSDDSDDSEDDMIICRDCNRQFISDSAFEGHACRPSSKKPSGACFRCGRPGHYVNNCYARRDINGDEIEPDEDY